MGRWTRQELEEAAQTYRLTARRSATSGDWTAWANLFTEDATSNEHHFGRFCGRDAIDQWIGAIMKPYPMNEMIYFPWTWHVIDEERCEKARAEGRNPRDARHLAAIEGVEVKR